jgi:endoglucanase
MAVKRAAPPVLVLVLLTACSAGGTAPATGPDAAERARTAAREFLATYVGADGRVARIDQGNDTVSEGQSYALLLAEVAGDDAATSRVWQWTAAHLQRPDGLLSAHSTADGSVDDLNSATDADLVTAWALLRDQGPVAAAHHDAGRRLAAAVVDHETVTTADGRFLLAAGNWATGTPATLNPSYWALPAIQDLARLTGDTRWTQLAATSVTVVDELTRHGAELPPDWARVDGAVVSATPAPNHQAPDVRYALDAQRIPVWFASGGANTAALGAAWASVLNDDVRCRAMALSVDGTILDGASHPTALVAAAAAAAAAGRRRDRDRLLAEAEQLNTAHPTYYGAAWVALGRALLTTDLWRTDQP